MSWNYEPLINCHIKYKYQYTETHLGNVKSFFNSKTPLTITKARPIDRPTLLLIYRIISRAFESMSYIPAQSNFALLGTSKYPTKFFEYNYVMCVKDAVLILVSLLNIPLIIMDNNRDHSPVT